MTTDSENIPASNEHPEQTSTVEYMVKGFCCALTGCLGITSGLTYTAMFSKNHYETSPTLGTPECEGFLIYRANPSDLPHLMNYTTYSFGNEHTVESNTRTKACIKSLVKPGDTYLREIPSQGDQDSKENCNKTEIKVNIDTIITDEGLLCNGWDANYELMAYNHELATTTMNGIFDILEQHPTHIQMILDSISKDTTKHEFLRAMTKEIASLYKETNSLEKIKMKYKQEIQERYNPANVWRVRQNFFSNGISKRMKSKAEIPQEGAPKKLVTLSGANHVAKQKPLWNWMRWLDKRFDEGVDEVHKTLEKYADGNPYAILIDPTETSEKILDLSNAKKIGKR